MGPDDREVLRHKIVAFAGIAAPGETENDIEFDVDSTLTSYDRRLVHEFAEQIGLGHRCEGTRGHD